MIVKTEGSFTALVRMKKNLAPSLTTALYRALSALISVDRDSSLDLVPRCCTVLYCTALHCTVLYCTVLYSTVLYCTVLGCA